MSYESDMSRARDIVRELSAIFDRYDEDIPPGPVPPTEKPKAITSLVIETEEYAVPLTWGQVFKVGDVHPGDPLMARWSDGSATQLQVDGKASHADGSLRHAIISTIAVGGKLEIVKGTPKSQLGGMKTMYTHAVSIVLDGITYTASVIGKDRWLDGPIVTEYNGAAPFSDKDGKQHPHLHLRTASRCYAGETTRFDFAIENDWAYELNPQNFTYDISIEIGGKVVYEQKALTHYHHARWRKVFWAGRDAPQVNIRHDPRYLIDTLAVPNYDPTVEISEKYLASEYAKWSWSKTEPMGIGSAGPAMPNTGGRNDIGILPGWSVAYLLSMDKRSASMMLGTGDGSGSWSMHYRDRDTDQPISLLDYPYMTTQGTPGDTKNKATGKAEAFPSLVKGESKTPYVHDVPHHPSLSYLPYIVTGDRYYLEELQFWAMFCVFTSNPGYRQNVRGLLKPHQVRGQAWGLRSLADAAYITPDGDRLKSHLSQLVDSNLDWYLSEYANNPEANKLGFLKESYAVVYNDGRGIAPWQDDFFTMVLGTLVDRGFEKAKPILEWKLKYPISRMIGEGACWIRAAMYSMNVRENKESPFYEYIGKAFEESENKAPGAACGSEEMAKALKLQVGEMTGYSGSVIGYPSIMQAVLSYASDYGGEAGKKAWHKIDSRTVKPNYGVGAQFAIVPRAV